MLAYLSGAIENAPDGGRGWRSEITPFLTGVLGHLVYDPALDQRKHLTQEEAALFRTWKLTNPSRFRRVVRKIIAFDMAKLTRESDYVVGYWDTYARMGGGTHAELTAAHLSGRPVYLVNLLSLSELPGWVFACADEVFSGFDDLRAFLLKRFRRKRR